MLSSTPQLKMLVHISLLLAVLLSAARFCRAEVESQDSSIAEVRHKRGPTQGLFAFPRVGRSDPDLLEWGEVAAELADDYDDYPIREAKRQGKLVAFPRVGRAGFNAAAAFNGREGSNYNSIANANNVLSPNLVRYWPSAATVVQKRAGNSGANSGMWFGPRLGKRAPVASTEIKGNDVYTPRLGRDPEDNLVASRLLDFGRLFWSSQLPEN